MSPPGITPEWSSSDYFDDDSDLGWSIGTIEELRAAVGKCLATAERSQDGLALHFDALDKAAARLEQTPTNSPDLADATVHLRNAANVVQQARELLVAAQGNGEAYLEGL